MKYYLIILLLLSCKKEPQKASATFYQLNCQGSPKLYVDDKYIGVLKQVPQQPVCGDKIPNKIYTIEFIIGEHTFKLDDGKGTYHKRYFNLSEKCQTIKVD